MQRYSAASCGGVGSNSISGGSSIRDRTDSSFTSSSFTVNSRRSSQLAPYKLKCEKESLSGRLGPPDFYPQTPNCPEETLTREYLQSGYKETVDGIEEAKEIVLSQVGGLTKPVIIRCKEAIRKHLRSINESRAQKRKAGQSYGVPLSGQLLVKPLLFPELRSCGEDSRKKWIEALSQHHRGLRSLADHIPHGFRKKALLDVIIRHNVPLLKATWFIKITYLNQVRPNPSGISSGTPDKSQTTRTELWTRDVIEYLQYLLDDMLLKNGLYPSKTPRDQPSLNLLSIPSHQRTDVACSPAEGIEHSLQFKWQYMINLLKWHFAEGLLSPPLIIEWSLSQLQEKESVETLELLLPIILDLMDIMVQSQTYVKVFIDMAIHFLRVLCPCPYSMDAINNAKRPHIVAALVEMLRYFLLTVPDTFVTLDCFPLPAIVIPDTINAKTLDMPTERNFNSKIPEASAVDWGSQDSYCRYLSFGHVASSLQRRATNLAKIANPSIQGHGVAKLLQALDKAVVSGDLKWAYSCLFEDTSDGAINENWIAEVSCCLRSSLKWIGTCSSSIISAVFFLLEWATCDFRDFRTCQPSDVKFTGRKDFSQVHIAVLLLKLKLEDILRSSQLKMGNSSLPRKAFRSASPHGGLTSGMPGEAVSLLRGSPRGSFKAKSADILRSPGQLHDIIVCWLDQHEAGKGEGFKRLEILMMELIRLGIFYPQAYVRQLIVSGIMDRIETAFDLERQRRHLRILKQLPGGYLLEILEESDIADASSLGEAVHVFSNERKFILDGISGYHSADLKAGPNGSVNHTSEKFNENSVLAKDASPSLLGKRKNQIRGSNFIFGKHAKKKTPLAELKLSISALLCLPDSCSTNKVHQSELQGNGKRSTGSSLEMNFDLVEGKPGCEECTRAKRQRIYDEKFPSSETSSNHFDDDDMWWIRKEAKSLESFKEEHAKSTKSSSRSRQKSVRKTQSLAQLAAARIEGSQGTSTSHICESKVNCTHHISNADVENVLSDGTKNVHIANIGKSIKKLRWLEKRSIAIWLLKSIKQLVGGSECTVSKVSQPFSPLTEERSVARWKLREDVLSSVLYLLDISLDLYSAVKFLIWLFPLVRSGVPSAHVGRTAGMQSKNSESHVVDVGESYIVAALQRYENMLVALDLLPEVLSTAMHRSLNMIASNGRASGSLAFIYARNLLRRYGKLSSVVKWEKNFRSTCDQRLLAELETGRSLDAEFPFSLGIFSGEDADDFLRQKISGRPSRAGQSMKEIVQKHLDDAISGKERKPYGHGGLKLPTLENLDATYQVAHQIVFSLLDCMRQHRGSTQEWDPSLVAAAISAVVGNVGPSCSSYQNLSSSLSSLNHIQQIVRLHLACLCLLKEAFGERMDRVFEIALTTEASSGISSAFATGKTQRGQFQLSPEIHDIKQNSPNDVMNNFSKVVSGRSLKAPAAVSALVIGAVIHGLASLERVIAALRLKEGLDFMQFVKSARSSANGLSRSTSNFKLDHSVEVYVHWFRLLVGNYRTVFDGLVVDILGEGYTLALSRMQRMLSPAVAFPLAYSIFTMVIWRPYMFNSNITAREDIQLYQCLSVAIDDAIRHQPFRDLCLRDSQMLFDLMASDATEPEFASTLELHTPDKHFKIMAFVPLRARLFLNAIVDCRMPSFSVMQEDGSWHPGRGEPRHSEKEGNLRDQIVNVLDTLQPAKFHWQWLELRLLLNEQALIEKIESQNMSLVEAIRSLSPTAENFTLSEDESTFTEIVLTRLLVRPDAASLYSEVFHLLGRSLDEKLLLHAKWLLSGTDVLYGRKSLRQRLVSVAQLKGLTMKVHCWKPWGWSRTISDVFANRDEKRKIDVSSLEEGEVVEEGHESKKFGKANCQAIDIDVDNTNQFYVVDKPLLELVLPCIDRSTPESRSMFASEMIKQLSSIDQQITSLTRGSNKQIGGVSAVEGSSKGSNRKGMRGGSPGLGRRATAPKDMSPPSISALRASIWLRLQFLLRLLPIIYADRDQSNRNSKHLLSSVLLHLLCSPVVYENLDAFTFPAQRSSRRDSESTMEAPFRPSLDLSGDSLFDRVISVLHGLLSGSKPGWLKGRSISKSTVKSPWEFLPFDRELIDRLQMEVDRMQLPSPIRWRLQAAMPMLRHTPPLSISCQPPVISPKYLSSSLLLFPTPGNQDTNSSSHRVVTSGRPPSNASGKNNPSLHSDSELEIDPWTLLEDGTASISPSNSGGLAGGSSDQPNMKACYWLKGAVRTRRTDISYAGTMDEDS